jgi:hypothetical protein
MLTYAATTPETLTPAQRQQYATFLLYAIGDGQTSGVQAGQLPNGYVPLPGPLRLVTLGAVNSILNPPAPATATTTSAPTPSAPAPTDSGSSGSSFPLSSLTPDTTPVPATTPGAGSGGAPAVHGTTTPVLSIVRTSWFGAGAVRWALPLVLLIGVGAGLGALLLGRPRRSPITPGSQP